MGRHCQWGLGFDGGRVAQLVEQPRPGLVAGSSPATGSGSSFLHGSKGGVITAELVVGRPQAGDVVPHTACYRTWGRAGRVAQMVEQPPEKRWPVVRVDPCPLYGGVANRKAGRCWDERIYSRPTFRDATQRCFIDSGAKLDSSTAVVQLPVKEQVGGSIPSCSANKRVPWQGFCSTPEVTHPSSVAYVYG